MSCFDIQEECTAKKNEYCQDDGRLMEDVRIDTSNWRTSKFTAVSIYCPETAEENVAVASRFLRAKSANRMPKQHHLSKQVSYRPRRPVCNSRPSKGDKCQDYSLAFQNGHEWVTGRRKKRGYIYHQHCDAWCVKRHHR